MIITQTPLRISLLGGNTDFPDYYLKHGGLALTTAIDKYIYCIVKDRFDDKICVSYSIKEAVDKVDELKHELVREAMKLVGIEKGIEIAFMSDIPSEGSGLGSSSTVTVGVLNALHNYVNDPVSAKQLAEEACHIEREILKKPIGVQDQYIVAYGGLRKLVFNHKVEAKKVSLVNTIREDFDNSLMLFYTNRTRSSSAVLSSMKLDEKILGVNKKIAEQGIKALEHGDIGQFGRLLHKYWNFKKKLNGKVSDKEIDKMYSKARKAGAVGGKIVGAGGGGFLLLMVPSSHRVRVRKALKGFRELPFRMIDSGSQVIYRR